MSRRITLVRPSDMFKAMEDSMSNFMNDFGINTSLAPAASIDVNIKEMSDRYEVSAKVPGYKKDEVDISFHENMLILEGHTKEEKKDEQGDFIMQEYSEGNFKRAISLPGKIDSEKVEATLEDGVLKLSLPKLPEVMPKKISIK